MTLALQEASTGLKRENWKLCFGSWFPSVLGGAGYTLGQCDAAERHSLIDCGVGALLPLGTARIVACVRTEELLDIARALPPVHPEGQCLGYSPMRTQILLILRGRSTLQHRDTHARQARALRAQWTAFSRSHLAM